MRFPSPLRRGRLVQRYKRFFADVRLDDGTLLTAHCPNPGAMLGLGDPGLPVWVSTSDDAKRRLAHTLELVEVDLGRGPCLVGVNTGHPNRLVAEALGGGRIAELAGYPELRREVRYGAASRVDFLLACARRGLCYVEVKNVHLMRIPGRAEFPDCRTERGARHLAELAAMAAAGHRAVMVYLVQRADAETFSIAADLDPAYAAAFAVARRAGVEALAYRCRITPEEIVVDASVPISD
jgi:sugar fermentation stimulation protein A